MVGITNVLNAEKKYRTMMIIVQADAEMLPTNKFLKIFDN
jgi:hypothetical protein